MAEELKYTLRADAKPFNSAVGTAAKGAQNFERATKKAGTESSRALRDVENRLASMNKLQNSAVVLSRGMGIAFAAAAAVAGTGFAGLTRLTEEMDAAGKTASKLGLTTEALTSLRYAVEQTSEMTGGQFDVALQRMVRRLAEAAQGTGEAKNAIAELGLDAAKLNAMNPDQAFKAIADQMAKVPNQADRVRLAFKLFDTEGVNLVNTLQEGSGEIDRLQQKAVAMGIAFNDNAAKGAAQFNDELADLKATFKGVIIELTNGSGVVGWLGKEFREFSEDIAQAKKDALAMADPVNQLSLGLNDMKRQAMNLRKEINAGPSLFGKSTFQIQAMQKELKALEKQIEIDTKKMQGLIDARKPKPSNSYGPSVLPPVNIGYKPPTGSKTSGSKKKGESWSAMLDAQNAGFGDNPFATPSATGDWRGMLGEQTGAFNQDFENAQSQISTLESVYAIGLDRERAFRDERLAIVQNALDQEAVSVEAAAELKNQIEQSYQDAQIATASDGFATIANLMNTNNEKMFKIGKAASIVQTTIDTYQSAMAAYKAMAGIPIVGPALGAAAAGAAVAFGMSQVSAINSQQFTPSAEGGYDIPAGVNPLTQLHEKEMVLPKAQAEIIRQMAGNGSGSNMGGGASVNFNISNALDGAGIEEVLMGQKDLIVNMVRRGLR